jgi:alkanesulfonate monooxygenase SsuD/methylene tetrahydromethanopterin reductase-like flavin-dependent oxidoreductase (luciferase family)
VNGPDKEIARRIVADIRAGAEAHGRNPRDVLVFLGRTAVVGRTRAEAEEKYREYHRHASIEGALAHFSSSTGIDLSRYDMDEPICYVKTDAMNSAVDAITRLSSGRWTKRRIIGQMVIGSRNPPIVGSADEVADELIGWVEDSDIDGFKPEPHRNAREPAGLHRSGRADFAGTRCL